MSTGRGSGGHLFNADEFPTTEARGSQYDAVVANLEGKGCQSTEVATDEVKALVAGLRSAANRKGHGARVRVQDLGKGKSKVFVELTAKRARKSTEPK